MAGPLQRGHAMAALVLGAIELLCGVLVIVLAIVLAGKANLPAAFSPWWAGVVFAVPGIIGIIVGITKSYGCMIAFMVLNIIAFIIQGVGAVLLGIAMAIFVGILATISDNCTFSNGRCICTENGSKVIDVTDVESCDVLTSVASMSIAIVAFLVIAGVISLAASIVGCCGTCCNSNSTGGAVIYNNPPPK